MYGTSIATASRILWRMLELRDIDPGPLFREAGLDPERLTDPRARYPGKEARLAWARASDMVDDPSFGLTSAKVWQPTDFHALGFAFLASTTLRSALERVVYYHAVVDNDVSYSLLDYDDHATLTFTTKNGGIDEPAIIEDVRWAIVLDACRRLHGPDLKPLEVTFVHRDPGSYVGVFSTFFRCPMRFGEPVSSLTISAEVLDKPLFSSNLELTLVHDRLLKDFVGKLQGTDIVSRTKSAISEGLPSGKFTSEVAARAFHMSSRNLQRKLAVEGVTFRELVQTVRQELAEAYLVRGGFTLGEITYLLGFSDQSSFSRAFKRWTGSTPQEYRGRS